MKGKVLALILTLITLTGVLAGCFSPGVDEIAHYRLSLTIIGEGNVEVLDTKDGRIIRDVSRTNFLKGTELTIIAKPGANWDFDRWGGNTFTGSENPIKFKITSNVDLIAVFDNPLAPLTVTVEQIVGKGTVELEPKGKTSFIRGETVRIIAVPGDENWVFSHWQGDLAGSTANPAVHVMERSIKVIPIFYEKNQHQGITFEDANLGNAVRAAINKFSGPITIEDIEELYTLDASVRPISTLAGIEHLKPLTSLNLYMTGISNIGRLASLTNLEYLYLNNNTINDISVVADLINLQVLDLSSNKEIKDISPIYWLWGKQLERLYLGDNQITNIVPLSGLTDLTHLSLAKNNINSVQDLSKLTELRELNLHDNKIADITPLGNMRYLEKLDVSKNQMTKVGDLVWLWELDGGSLKEINFSHNQIADINALYGLKKLEKIDLSHNKLTRIGVFTELKNVKELHLNGNMIEDISALENMIPLERLYLHDNRLRDIRILLKLNNLKEVTLQDNDLLDTRVGSPDYEVILELRRRGVIVRY